MATDIEEFVGAKGRDDAVREVRKRIDAEGVEYMYYQFVRSRAASWGRAFRRRTGTASPTGVPARLRLDGEPVHRPRGQLHRLRARGARSWWAFPSPKRSSVLPWDQRTAACSARCSAAREEEVDGARSDVGLPRKPQRLHTSSEEHRPAPAVGCEPEMMWLKLNPDGSPSVEGKTKPYCYHIDQFSELQPIIHKVMEYSRAMGLDMIQGDHEDAPGELELNFMFYRAEFNGRPALPPTGRAAARSAGKYGCVRVLHAEAVHGRVGERLPPQHLAVAVGGEHVLPGRRQPADAGQDRPARHRGRARAPGRAHGDHRDRELVPAGLGRGVLGARSSPTGASRTTGSPPGRSVRPTDPANRTSPVTIVRSTSTWL